MAGVQIVPFPAAARRELSAVYFGLLQQGYDYYAMGRPAQHAAAVRQFFRPGEAPGFFSAVRQNTCEVYPYWPRAAILETATFYLRENPPGFRDWEGFRQRILSARNISPRERDQALWDWIAGFPAALNAVLSGEDFQRYWDWERQWLAEQASALAPEVQRLEQLAALCRAKYATPCRQIQLVVQPIKCAYSADYFWDGDCFTYISGCFRVDSVIHELLHPVLHPLVPDCRELLSRRTEPFPEIDPSYYLTGDSAGWQNAFEEHAVRTLTQRVLRRQCPDDLPDFLTELLRPPA